MQNGRMDPVFRASRIALMISYALARCCFSARRIGDFIPKKSWQLAQAKGSWEVIPSKLNPQFTSINILNIFDTF